MKLLIKFQSISDIITNSSSEIFTIIDGRPFNKLKELIEQIGEGNLPSDWKDSGALSEDGKEKFDSFSGDGGTLEVKNWEDLYNDWLEWIPVNKRSQSTPEIWALRYPESLEELKKQIQIEVDWNRSRTIDWIFRESVGYKSLWWIL